MRNVLSVTHIGPDGLRWVLDRAAQWKRGEPEPLVDRPLAVLLLERTAFRTRLAYEGALLNLGGSLVPFERRLESRESLDDVARVLSHMSDVVLARVKDHGKLETLAEMTTVPVINALSSQEHPVEVLADALVLVETFGDLMGKKIAFAGDGGNVCQSLLLLAPLLGMDAAVSSPAGYASSGQILDQAAKLAAAAGCAFSIESEPGVAVQGACAVYTDGWPLVNDDLEATERLFGSYRVDEDLMALADAEAIFLHCLPARRGREVTAGVIDGPQSRAFDRLDNLVPTSTALLEWAMSTEASRQP